MSSVKKNKENDKYAFSPVSAKTISEINSLSIPPGFPPKRNNMIEDEDSSEEDGLTIAQMLKYFLNCINLTKFVCYTSSNDIGMTIWLHRKKSIKKLQVKEIPRT